MAFFDKLSGKKKDDKFEDDLGMSDFDFGKDDNFSLGPAPMPSHQPPQQSQPSQQPPTSPRLPSPPGFPSQSPQQSQPPVQEPAFPQPNFGSVQGLGMKEQSGMLPGTPQMPQMPQMPNTGLPPAPPAPSPQGQAFTPGMQSPQLPPLPNQQAPIQNQQDNLEPILQHVEEVTDAIVGEKWDQLTKELDTLQDDNKLKETKISALEKEINSLKAQVDGLEQSIFQKVEDYGKGINDVHTELKAMERVFKDVMPEFTENVKTLSAIAEKKKK